MRQRVSRRGWIAIILPPLGFLALYAIHAPHQPLLNPDSQGYLDFAPIRSGGYPFFLTLLKPLVRDLGDYAVAQRVLYTFAVMTLGYQVARGFDRLWAAAAVELVLLFNPEVSRYHFAILTESVFLSVSALLVAAAIAHLRTGSTAWLAGAAACAGALTAIRPTGYAFIPALAILVFNVSQTHRAGWITRAAAVVLTVAAVLALESLYYAAYHAGSRESLAPAHLLAKAGMVEAASTPRAAAPNTTALQDALETSLASVRRLIAEAPNLPARCLLGSSYEVFVQYGFAPQQRAEAVAADGSKALLGLAMQRLTSDPFGAAVLALRHFACLWTLGAADAEQSAAMHAYIERHRPLPFEAAVLPGIEGTRLPPFPTVVRNLMLAAAVLLAVSGVALLLIMARGRRPTILLASAGLCGLVTHGSLLLTAIGSIGIPRYVIGLWVPLASGVGLTLLWLATEVLPALAGCGRRKLS